MPAPRDESCSAARSDQAAPPPPPERRCSHCRYAHTSSQAKPPPQFHRQPRLSQFDGGGHLWPSSHAPLAPMYAASVSTTFAPQPSSQRNRYGLPWSPSVLRSCASARISSLTSRASSADEYMVPPGWWASPETRPYTRTGLVGTEFRQTLLLG